VTDASYDDVELPEPWDPIQDETPAAFAGFTTYLNQGPKRRLRGTAIAHYNLEDCPLTSPKLRQVKTWSAQNRWAERAMAYDLWRENEIRRDAIEAEKDMRRRHASVASVALQKAAEKLRALNPADLSPRDAVTFMDLAVKVERLARDVPDKHEVSGPNGGPIALDVESLEAKIAQALDQLGVPDPNESSAD
jgi:hypothetical protein